MILIVDNYDSFVHNLARYVREAGGETRVLRNDAARAAEMIALEPAAVILSPGPKGPAEAGVCLDLIAALPRATPLLGVCLGHQCLVEAFGGRTVRARRPLHGEASLTRHDGTGVFEGLPSPIETGRYHSLISVLGESDALVSCAWSEEGEIMAVRHRAAPWFGVQFHPESLLTPHGRAMIGNFLKKAAGVRMTG
ncbi:anthranilate synthase component II [Amphiplicatus metriothermophilus]|uniref:Anthranilate synthase component 2/para-aminobenzoate synthetase component 2 n=1 Tax=Amphiplicatus metriothermophilus TaxID=1519374 RepID=A0A239PLK1_9PROT|nr:aminodeoxychorismate/anthranilate synthase component II [Amphiplicatus metriothermophilus]MBB5517234.1 anthranilate synthase component 2/para-aminobenzoate synthetase component 2 [Amphiplicatus metriothermophilus]SNT68430.1 anthranilate synthase component 2/para-aminobenzoate synthetase component 2 [Amphiplicatus metriothermophilus]